MSNLQTKKVGKRLIKLIITSSILFLFFNSAFSQKTFPDTVQFKRDFEKLLLKYGLDSKTYLINVQSVNQKGGQTAFVINNNYYGDSLNGKNNFGYRIDSVNKQKIIYCGPLKGVWVTPFIAMDSAKFRSGAYDPGIGLVTSISGITAIVDGKTHSLEAVASNNSCSQMFPMKIHISETDTEEFFIFGDLQDPLKTYLYFKEQIFYFGDEGDGQKKGIH